MQSRVRFHAIDLKQIGPIKIRDVRVTSRKSKKIMTSREGNSSSEYGNSTAVSQKSISRVASSQKSTKPDFDFFQIDGQDPFLGIQEVNENSEYEEDSVLMQLNELLATSSKTEARKSTETTLKPPIASLKSKIKDRIGGVISSRKIVRAISQRSIRKPK